MTWSKSGTAGSPRRPSRRHLIIDEAIQQFIRRGVGAVGPTDIASGVEMTPSAVRYHFPDPDDLLHEIFDPLLDRLEHIVAEHLDADSDLRALLRDYALALVDHREAAVLLDRDPAVRAHSEFGERLEHVNARVRTAIAGPEQTMEHLAAASAALGSLWRPLTRFTYDGPPPIDAILDVALSGHRAGPTGLPDSDA